MNTVRLLHYQLLVFRREQLWLPAGLWALFAVMILLLQGDTRADGVARSFLGAVLPLAAGLLAASAVVDDPALELQLAAPRRPWRMLIERLVALLGIVALLAASHQLFLAIVGVDMAYPGGTLLLQLVWLVPSLAMMGLSSLVAMGLAQALPASMMVGLVWVIQLLRGAWFAHSDWGRPVYLFLGASVPGSPHLPANLLCLLTLAVALLLCASLLLNREERYL